MLRSSLCDYSDTCILVQGTITLPNPTATNPNNRKNIMIRILAPFTDSISEISNTQKDNVKEIDIVMPMYNLREYSDTYFKTSGSLWQYYRDASFLDNNGAIADFSANNDNSARLNLKQKQHAEQKIMVQKMLNVGIIIIFK